MNMETQRSRDRATYQKQWNELRNKYYQIPENHPDFHLSWEEFRTKYLHAPGHAPRRKSTSSADRTDRQQYQATYQRGYQAAQKYYKNTPSVRKQHGSFGAYWKAMRHTYLPNGFLAGKKHMVHIQRGNSCPKDRSDYMVAWRRNRRLWENNEIMRQEFPIWSDFWAHVKEKGFRQLPAARPPVAVCLEGDPEPDNQPWV